MDFIWESESLTSGWLLPAGAALIALGLTSVGAALWMHFHSRTHVVADRSGEHVDALDEIETVAVAPREETSIVTDTFVLSQLDEEILRLEAELGKFELLSRSRPNRPAPARSAEVRFVGSRPAQGSPETQALAALVARGH